MERRDISLDEKIAEIRRKNEKIEERQKLIEEDIRIAKQNNAMVQLKSSSGGKNDKDDDLEFGSTLYSDKITDEDSEKLKMKKLSGQHVRENEVKDKGAKRDISRWEHGQNQNVSSHFGHGGDEQRGFRKHMEHRDSYSQGGSVTDRNYSQGHQRTTDGVHSRKVCQMYNKENVALRSKFSQQEQEVDDTLFTLTVKNEHRKRDTPPHVSANTSDAVRHQVQERKQSFRSNQEKRRAGFERNNYNNQFSRPEQKAVEEEQKTRDNFHQRNQRVYGDKVHDRSDQRGRVDRVQNQECNDYYSTTGAIGGYENYYDDDDYDNEGRSLKTGSKNDFATYMKNAEEPYRHNFDESYNESYKCTTPMRYNQLSNSGSINEQHRSYDATGNHQSYISDNQYTNQTHNPCMISGSTQPYIYDATNNYNQLYRTQAPNSHNTSYDASITDYYDEQFKSRARSNYNQVCKSGATEMYDQPYNSNVSYSQDQQYRYKYEVNTNKTYDKSSNLSAADSYNQQYSSTCSQLPSLEVNDVNRLCRNDADYYQQFKHNECIQPGTFCAENAYQSYRTDTRNIEQYTHENSSGQANSVIPPKTNAGWLYRNDAEICNKPRSFENENAVLTYVTDSVAACNIQHRGDTKDDKQCNSVVNSNLLHSANFVATYDQYGSGGANYNKSNMAERNSDTRSVNQLQRTADTISHNQQYKNCSISNTTGNIEFKQQSNSTISYAKHYRPSDTGNYKPPHVTHNSKSYFPTYGQSTYNQSGPHSSHSRDFSNAENHSSVGPVYQNKQFEASYGQAVVQPQASSERTDSMQKYNLLGTPHKYGIGSGRNSRIDTNYGNQSVECCCKEIDLNQGSFTPGRKELVEQQREMSSKKSEQSPYYPKFERSNNYKSVLPSGTVFESVNELLYYPPDFEPTIFDESTIVPPNRATIFDTVNKVLHKYTGDEEHSAYDMCLSPEETLYCLSAADMKAIIHGDNVQNKKVVLAAKDDSGNELIKVELPNEGVSCKDNTVNIHNLKKPYRNVIEENGDVKIQIFSEGASGSGMCITNAHKNLASVNTSDDTHIRPTELNKTTKGIEAKSEKLAKNRSENKEVVIKKQVFVSKVYQNSEFIRDEINDEIVEDDGDSEWEDISD